jgi:hypothetical protein
VHTNAQQCENINNKEMNIKLKSKKEAVLIFCTLTVLMFFGFQTPLHLEEVMSQTDVYKYDTKEFNSQSQAAFYDFEARYYNPAIGRFAMINPRSA